MSEIGTPSPEEIGVPRTLEQGHDETLATYDEAVNTLLQMEPYRRSAAGAIINGSNRAPFYLPGEGWFNVYRNEYAGDPTKTLIIEEGRLTDQEDRLPEAVNPYIGDFFPLVD